MHFQVTFSLDKNSVNKIWNYYIYEILFWFYEFYHMMASFKIHATYERNYQENVSKLLHIQSPFQSSFHVFQDKNEFATKVHDFQIRDEISYIFRTWIGICHEILFNDFVLIQRRKSCEVDALNAVVTFSCGFTDLKRFYYLYFRVHGTFA